MNEGKMFTFGACGLGTRSRFGRVACVVEKWKMETRKCLSRETVLATQDDISVVDWTLVSSLLSLGSGLVSSLASSLVSKCLVHSTIV